jgi:hypothetical protein
LPRRSRGWRSFAKHRARRRGANGPADACGCSTWNRQAPAGLLPKSGWGLVAHKGSGTDVRVARHNLVAMVEANRTDRPLLVAMMLFAPSDSGTG